MSKVRRQNPAFSFAHPQIFGDEDTGDIGSSAIILADAGGKVLCHTWCSLGHLVLFTSLHTCKDQPVPELPGPLA